MADGPWTQFQTQDDSGPWSQFDKKLPPLKGERDEPEQKPGLITRAVGAITGGLIRPPLELVTHQAQAGRQAQEALGLARKGDTTPQTASQVSYPLPNALGGRIDVQAPQNATQAARQIAGEGIKTASLVSPIHGLSPLKAGALIGGLYGAGEATENAQTPLGAAGDVAGGAATGALIGKGTELAGKAAQGLYRVARDPALLKPYLLPKAQAGQVGEEIAQNQTQQAAIETQRYAANQKLREQSGDIQMTKDTLLNQRRKVSELAKSELTKAGQEWETSIAAGQDQLNTAVEKNVPFLKNQVRKVSSNMTTAYGKVLDEAIDKGGEFLRSDFNAKVAQPVLEMMDADRVPEDAPVRNAIKKIMGEGTGDMPAPLATPSDMLTARDFKHIAKQIDDTMSQGVKNGTVTAGMYDRWAVQFKGLQGDFIAEHVPELSQMNKDYAKMAFARKLLSKKAVAWSDMYQNGAKSLLDKIATGDLDADTKAAIKLAEEGSGKIPGIGKGTIGSDVKAPGQDLMQRQRSYDVVKGKIQRDLAIERQSLTDQINAQTTKMKELQVGRADISKQTNQIKELRQTSADLRAKQARLIKISRWERGLGIAAAAGAIEYGKAKPLINALVSAP